MARHRHTRGLTLSRARHRKPGPMQGVLERGIHSLIVSAAAAMLVVTMFATDPAIHSRS